MKITLDGNDFLDLLPLDPGVYKFFDSLHNLIYVGKANHLKKRVSSYFQKTHLDAKTRVLVKQIKSIEWLVVDSEIDALLLENNLIKQHKPRYNILLKDDKTYPWICIKKEPFPRVFLTRKKTNDNSQYFGPYPKGRNINVLLNLIRETYPLRTCNLLLSEKEIAKEKYKVCLEYHLKRCLGPCVSKQSATDYAQSIQEIKLLLHGKTFTLIQNLKLQMKAFSDALDFENALEIKNKIEAIEAYRSTSAIASEGNFNVDVLTLTKDDGHIYYNYLWVREGQIAFAISNKLKLKLDESEEEIAPLLIQYLNEEYSSNTYEILTNLNINRVIGPYHFVQPKIGTKARIVEFSVKNARNTAIPRKEKPVSSVEMNAVNALQEGLRLPVVPNHIECFDNSNFQGTNAVAACVVFQNGKPSKKDYRHFNIKSVVGPDDFASMYEIVQRRYTRVLAEGKALPDLIVIDGGKGQLSAAVSALESVGLRGKVAVIGLAKRLEEVFFPGDRYSVQLQRDHEGLKLLQRIRDEAHRFGITHHRNMRSNHFIQSEIEQIKGVGSKTIEKIYQHFGSLSKLTATPKHEIESILGKAMTQKVLQALEKPIS
ncbi:MAG: excinuclease ABC subunit UvrC [Flavobacteriia bacterium]|nr:excinuclease ABC subunit UvrC [Flavobacteriia bacterium]